jgi:hypothetical protein
MKRLIAILAVVGVLCAAAVANEGPALTLGPSYAGHVTTNTTAEFYTGYLDSLHFVVTPVSTYTGTVVVATSRETLLTVTDMTASTVKRPRLAPCDVTGGAVASTNERPYLDTERLTFTVTATSTNVLDTLKVTIRTTEQ